MFYCPEKYFKPRKDINETMKALKGELGDKEAKITLIRWLRANLGVAAHLIGGIRLYPHQEIMLKGFFNRNFSLAVMGRGIGKSTVAAIYATLQMVFEPESKIVIAGPTFRTARSMFNAVEKMVHSKGAELLAQAFDSGHCERRADLFEWRVNDGSMYAIPLNGEKVRGLRANVLVLDEFLLIPEDLINNVLMPFLVAPQDQKKRIAIRETEDLLIKAGKMTEEQRMVFANDAKMIGLSSASYTFENLYKTYKKWSEQIMAPGDGKGATYFICKMGIDSVPETMVDKSIVEEAASGNVSEAAYQREYLARFTDGSDSYFSMKKMMANTAKPGDYPTTLIKGEKDKKYVLSIDPNFSDAGNSDFFAMAILEIGEDKRVTLVHGYASPKYDLKKRINYLCYILTHFNIHLLIIDNAGWNFIASCNESELFRRAGLELKFFELDSDKEGLEYAEQLREAKKQYNKGTNTICLKKFFTQEFIRNANQHLQTCIDHGKLKFASSAEAHETVLKAQLAIELSKDDCKDLGFEDLLDLVSKQGEIITDTQKQCALIEMKSSASNLQSFNLPQNLKRDTSTKRARKDNYTALLLGVWGAKCYYDMMNSEEVKVSHTFTPRFIR